MASQIHKERTGKGLKITAEIVENEEMYEEEDDMSRFFRPTGNVNIPDRFQSFAGLHNFVHKEGYSTDNVFQQNVHDQFALAFPHLSRPSPVGMPQLSYGTVNPFGCSPQQDAYSEAMRRSSSASTLGSNHAFGASQPVSPATHTLDRPSPVSMPQLSYGSADPFACLLEQPDSEAMRRAASQSSLNHTVYQGPPGGMPVSPRSTMFNTASPGVIHETPRFSPGTFVPSPVPSLHSPMVTPPADGYFGALAVASSPSFQRRGDLPADGYFGAPAVSPSAMHTPNQRGMSQRASCGHRSSLSKRARVPVASAQPAARPASSDDEIERLLGILEPPSKRRRSRPTPGAGRDEALASRHSISHPKQPIFTRKLPGSVESMYREFDHLDEDDTKCPPFATVVGQQQTPINLQNPPPPRAQRSLSPRDKIFFEPLTISTDNGDMDIRLTTVDEDKKAKQNDGNGSGLTGGHLRPDAGFAFDTPPAAPEIPVVQNAGSHDDEELSTMQDPASTLFLGLLTNEAADNQFANWDDFLYLPPSQGDNEGEA